MNTTRERKDFFKSMSSSNRKLDSLARILSGNSICVAVSIINNRLIVAANELYENSMPTNRLVASINKVTLYFKKLACSEKLEDDERKNTFLAICSFRKLKIIMARSQIAGDEDLSNIIAEQIFDFGGYYTSDYVDSFEGNFLFGALASAEFTALYRDFRRLEKVFSGKNPIGLNNDLRTALKNDPIILTKETEPDVHCEAQLLSELLGLMAQKTKINKEYFFGISMLSCLKCRILIQVANEIFNKRDINLQIQFRGYHDLDFNKWNFPNRLSLNSKDPLSFEIRKAFEKQIEILEKLPAPKNVSMQSDPSKSSEIDAEEEVKKMELILESNLRLLEQIQKINLPIIQIIDNINDGKKLHESGILEGFYSKPEKKGKQILKENFLAVYKLAETDEILKDNSKTHLQEILKNYYYIGDVIANDFKICYE